MIIRKAQSTDASNLFILEQELFTVADYPLSKASFSYHIGNNMLYVAESDSIIEAIFWYSLNAVMQSYTL
jgi:[ribosomal protein S18]-alanine N-acetyltransferase